MKLRISSALALPLDAVTATIVVYGGKGMGKTNFGGVLAEELSAAGYRWSVLDPLGVWWGLRHSRDGKGAGIECLILGGMHGDIPIEPTAGAVIADLIVEESVNAIVDFSRKTTGEMWSKGEKIRFCTDYAVRLFQRQGEIIRARRRPPIMQILDEAARYIPQQFRTGDIDVAKCAGAWEQLVEEGRNVGIGVSLITQRSARMNKNVSELADMMVAFRTIGPNSIEAITDWLGEHIEKGRHREIIEKLRALPVGSALVVSPGWLDFEGVVPIRIRNTYDSSATPKAGEHRSEPRHGAKPDLEKYQARMAETIERAKADDPRALRAEISRLNKEIAAKPKAAAIDESAVARAVEQALRAERAVWKRKTDDLRRIWKNVALTMDRHLAEPHGSSFSTSNEAQNQAIVKSLRSGEGTKSKQSRAVNREFAKTPVDYSQNYSSAKLGAGERRVLIALAQYANSPVSIGEIMILVGQKERTVQTYLGNLRARNLCIGTGHSGLQITAEGIAELGDDFQPLPKGRALQDYWLARLPGGEAALLRILIAAFPAAKSIGALMSETGQAERTVQTYLGNLRKRRLIGGTGHTGITAASELFTN